MWSEACEMLARAERMHREIFRPGATQTRQAAWEPPVDILETEREVLVLVALPGVDGDSAQAVIEDSANCAPQPSIASSCRKGASIGDCRCRAVATAA
jgi:HSP20 family protein